MNSACESYIYYTGL